MINHQKKHILRLNLGLLSVVTALTVCSAVQASPSSEEIKDKTSELKLEIIHIEPPL